MDLQRLIDGIFAYLEATYGKGHPFIAVVLAQLNAVIDGAGIPALKAWLIKNGFLAAGQA